MQKNTHQARPLAATVGLLFDGAVARTNRAKIVPRAVQTVGRAHRTGAAQRCVQLGIGATYAERFDLFDGHIWHTVIGRATVDRVAGIAASAATTWLTFRAALCASSRLHLIEIRARRAGPFVSRRFQPIGRSACRQIGL